MSENEYHNEQEISTPAPVTSSTQIPQISEDKIEEEEKYLLDNNQFLKFGHLLGEKKNTDFIKKIIDTPLIHSKRFFPINKNEYQIIKRYIESSLEEKKQKVNTEMNSSLTNEYSTPPPFTEPSLPLTTTTTTTTTTPPTLLPTTTTPSMTATTTPLPSTTNAIASSVISQPLVQNKAKSKFEIWQPTEWEIYKPSPKKV